MRCVARSSTPQQRLEDDVHELEQAHGSERHLLGLLDGDQLRHQLAEEHVTEGEDGEGDRDDEVVEVLPRLVADEEVRQAIDLRFHGGLADPAEAEARERDPELGHREIALEPRHHPARALEARILARRFRRMRKRRADLDERELCRDEEAVQENEDGCEEEPEHLGRTL